MTLRLRTYVYQWIDVGRLYDRFSHTACLTVVCLSGAEHKVA